MAASDVAVYGLLIAVIGLVLNTNLRLNGLAVKVAELRGDLAARGGEIAALGGKIDSLHGEVQAEFAKVRQELADRGTELSGEISGIRERLTRLESAAHP